jgi:hypothetical protein
LGEVADEGFEEGLAEVVFAYVYDEIKREYFEVL